MLVVKVPIENSLDNFGCSKAPNEIIANFPENYVAENGKEIAKQDLRLEEIHLDNKDIVQSNKLIYENSLDIIGKNEKSIFIGGDGSMSYSICKAFLAICNNEDKEPFLIVFDAHSDCLVAKEEPTNREWLRKLIEEGFPARQIMLVGNRVSSKEENEFLRENNIRIYGMKDLDDYQEMCDIIMEQARKHEIYLSIDIDVVDAIFVPGTARPESAGFTSRQLIYFVQRINMLKGLRVIDICEINPEKAKSFSPS